MFVARKGDSLTFHVGNKFSTFDQDVLEMESGWTCAMLYHGAWWYRPGKQCRTSNLNGLYLRGKSRYKNGVAWFNWTGNNYSLRFTEMKIKAY